VQASLPVDRNIQKLDLQAPELASKQADPCDKISPAISQISRRGSRKGIRSCKLVYCFRADAFHRCKNWLSGMSEKQFLCHIFIHAVRQRRDAAIILNDQDPF